jgi:polar amino acid transport system permease protein
MFWTVTLSLFKGLGAATQLFFLTLLFSLPLGLVIAFGSMSKWQPLRFLLYRQEAPGPMTRRLAHLRPVSALVNILVWIIRGTPLMLQLIIIFYGPGIWFDNNIWSFSSGRMTACTVAFVINYSCYFSVIFRGGIQGVPVGQREAGEVLGMTKRQIFFKVTLLQMVKRVIPPMSNEIITLVKDTSLARIIAITELIKAGESYMKSAGITWPLFYTAVYYLVFVGVLSILFSYIERRLSYFR